MKNGDIAIIVCNGEKQLGQSNCDSSVTITAFEFGRSAFLSCNFKRIREKSGLGKLTGNMRGGGEPARHKLKCRAQASFTQ